MTNVFVPPCLDANTHIARKCRLFKCDRSARFFILPTSHRDYVLIAETYVQESGFESIFFRYFEDTRADKEWLETPDMDELRRIFLSALAEGVRLRRETHDVRICRRYHHVTLDEICTKLSIPIDELFSKVFDICVDRDIIDVRNGFANAQVSNFLVHIYEERWSMGIKFDWETASTHRKLLIEHLKKKRWFAHDHVMENLLKVVAILIKKSGLTIRELSGDDEELFKRVFDCDTTDELKDLVG